MRKRFPTAFVIGAIGLAVLLSIFLVRKSAITGSFAMGGTMSSLAISPVSAGMVSAIAVGAVVLIAIFAGVGKTEF